MKKLINQLTKKLKTRKRTGKDTVDSFWLDSHGLLNHNNKDDVLTTLLSSGVITKHPTNPVLYHITVK